MMQIVYLQSARDDLVWVRTYYEEVFPEGRKMAQKQFHVMEKILLENPLIGFEIGDHDVREIPVTKTPFSYIYRLQGSQIQVLRIWDQRGSRVDHAL